ncbi:MAG: amidase [Acidobacteria bacterium]|nr:amidase [Acidobacteriota bacterium]
MNRLTDWLRAPREERERARHACLDRIRTLDSSLHAWVQVSPQPATGEGSLAGIPFGAKDIIETRGLGTEYGSPIYKGRIGRADAAIVQELRQLGAVLIGKTQTTAFAYRTPAPTRNPRNLEHTPGGSSSGSAAAVAAGMVPFALGTQTQGSVLRPASFCGVAGFKPTYGLVSLEGVLPLAPSLDTLGFFTATAADMLALWEALGHNSQRPTPNVQVPGRNWDSGIGSWELMLGVPDRLPDVEPPMAAALQWAVVRLRSAGLRVQTLNLEDMLARLHEASRVVMAYEAAEVHRERYEEHGSKLADLADLVREGQATARGRYDEARGFIAACRGRVAEIYQTAPVVLVPAATGPAPFSLASTGDPRMNSPWTALGTPAITIPMGEVEGLPLGLQLTADHGADARLLQAAVRVERLVGEAT